jgi:recombination protein RecT
MTTALANKLENAQAAAKAGVKVLKVADSVLGWLTDETSSREMAKAMPRGLDASRFARVVQTEVRRNPALLESEPRSFILAVLTAAQLGLEPGPLGLSYLVGPFKNSRTGKKETLLILGYKGLKELAYRAKTVDLIDAIAVHEGEPFRVLGGTDQRLEHEVLAACAENPIIAFYAIAFPRGGGHCAFDVMWPKDIAAIRKRSRAGNDGPWVSDFEAMALKTVTRRLLNRGKVRLTPEAQAAIAEDEARELGVDKPEILPDLTTIAAPAEAPPASPEAPSEPAVEPEAPKPEEEVAEPPAATHGVLVP